MKNLIFVNSSMEMGGPPRIISNWANFFIKKSYNVEIVSNIKKKSYYKLNKKIKYSSLSIDRFNQKKKFYAFNQIKNFIKKKKNCIIIFNKGTYIIYLFFLQLFNFVDKSNKIIYFAHSGSSDFRTIYNNLQNYLIYKTFDQIIVNHDDYYFDKKNFNFNQKIKTKIINCLIKFNWEKFKKKIIFIFNPIYQKSKIVSKLKNNNLLCVGRLDKTKGFERAIKSFKLLDYKKNKIRLKIVGEGPDRERLNLIIKQLNLKKYVKLLKPRSNLNKLYEESSILLLPSLHNEMQWREGMPMVLLEAMNFGLPIISSKNPGSRVLVKNNVNGFIYKNYSDSKLAEIIRKLVCDKKLRTKMGKKSKLFSDKFYIEKIFYSWKKILN